MEERKQQHIHPILSIWLHPRAAIQEIVDNEKKHGCMIHLWAVLFGLPYAIEPVELDSFRWIMQALVILFNAAIHGMTVFGGGCLSLYCTGKRLGGKASANHIVDAIAWSTVPTICAALLMLFIPESMSRIPVLSIVAIVVYSIAGIWSLILFFIFLSQVQGFTVWKVLVNILLAALTTALVAVLCIVFMVFVIGISVTWFSR